MRASGVLLPVFSLPSKYGIGCFSKEAYEFVDFLAEAGQTYWQVLPMGPTSYGDSPYQSFSTFAGNPYFVDIEGLIQKGWITKKDAEKEDRDNDPQKIDYEKLYKNRLKIFRKAYRRSGIEAEKEYKDFVKENAFWLEDYALFLAIKEANKGKSFIEWEDALRLRKKSALKQFAQEPKNAEFIACSKFIQYLFSIQWKKLKAYANEKGIRIIGDIPIYVAFDSADIGTTGQDCRYHAGIHVWEDQYITEIIDPKTGEVLPDGEYGEVVFTSLTREAMPIIRYRTHDISRILSREKCGCGRTSLRIDRITGRTDDMLIVKGVNFYPRQVEQALMEIPGVKDEFQIILEEHNGITDVTVNVEAEPGVTGHTVAKHLRERLGFLPKGDVFPIGSLPRSEGKAKRVIRRSV